MSRMNLRSLLFHEASLFQALGGLSMHTLPRLSFLLDALSVLSTDKSRLLLLFGISLTYGIRFPNAHPLAEEVRAIGLPDQFAFQKQINDRNISAVKENIDLLATQPI